MLNYYMFGNQQRVMSYMNVVNIVYNKLKIL